MTQNQKYIDYLEEDKPINGQSWVCLSFLSPEGIKNCSLRGLKVRGVYSTKEEADKRAKELQDIDPDFDVFVGEVGKWLPWDPDPNDDKVVQDQVYYETQLNDLMKGYKENIQKRRKVENQRKQDMLKRAAVQENANKSSANRTYEAKERFKKKLAERKRKQDNTTGKIDKPVEEQKKVLEQEKKVLEQEDEIISKKKAKLNNIDQKLDKLKQLYNKIKNK
jgi:DNA repair exonuclease SbcCD ATPase subunit